MKSIAIFFLFAPIFSFAQEDLSKVRDSIMAEGKRLYRSEFASWYGTDILVQNLKGDQNNIGGYFSYDEGKNETCVFYSTGANPNVLGSVTFDKDNKATLDTSKRAFSKKELEYYLLRTEAEKLIAQDTAFFKSYKNTTFNLVPLINENIKEVYILTGTGQNDIVIFGNDYHLIFDVNNKLISKKSLHKNIIIADYSKKEGDQGPVHNHMPETGKFITATDICTTMLYEKIAKWKQNMVVSEKYMSIWNCEEDQLAIIPYR